MLAAPAVALSAAVSLLAILIAISFAILVARTRRAAGIQPPAMSGDPGWSGAAGPGQYRRRLYRFYSGPVAGDAYFQGWIPPLIGLIWCIGRIIFAVGYMASAEKRHIGFGISILSVLALVLLAGFGVVQSLLQQEPSDHEPSLTPRRHRGFPAGSRARSAAIKLVVLDIGGTLIQDHGEVPTALMSALGKEHIPSRRRKSATGAALPSAE